MITELTATQWHVLNENNTKTVTVTNGNTATVTFANDPYGNLRVNKVDANSGAYLAGATVEIKHIETDTTYTGTTDLAGSVYFDLLKPGAYQVREIAAPNGYIMDSQTYTTTVPTGGEASYTITNKAKPGLDILKFDEQTRQPLANITFAV